MRSSSRKGLLPFGTLANTILLVFLCLLSLTSEQELLVLIPDVSEDVGFVENRESGSIVPIQGAYPWFLCRNGTSNDTIQNQGCPDSDSLVIHTRANVISLNLLRINGDGIPMPISDEATFEIITGNAATTVVAGQYVPTRRLYNISVDSEAERSDITLMANLGSVHRRINIRIDRMPPRVMEIQRFEIDYNTTPHRVSFLIIFSEEVFANDRRAACEVELMSLSAEHPEDELLRRSQTCNTNLRLNNNSNFSEVFILSDFDQSLPAESRTFRAGAEFYVFFSVFPVEGIATNITLEIPPNSVLDRAGTGNNNSNSTTAEYRPPRQSQSPEPSLEPLVSEDAFALPPEDASTLPSEDASPWIARWKPFFSSTDIGEASVVILITSIASSLVASITSSFLGGDMSPGSVRMLTQAQKLYLTGRVAVSDMPDTYRNFTEQFGWAMFDTIRGSPNSSSNVEQSSPIDPMLSIKEAPRIAYTDNSQEHYQDYLNQIVFWMPLVLGILVLGHLIALLLLFYYKIETPSFFAFPRLEIMFGYFSTPIIATASAGLFQGDKDIERFIGVWTLTAFVSSFVSFNIFIVWHTFFYTSVNKRKANMFVDLTSHSDHESEFLSRAYNFLNKRSSNVNPVEGNNPSRGVFSILSRARAEGPRQDPTGQAPAPTTPSRSIELVTTPHSPSEFAMHISGQATTSAGFAPLSNSEYRDNSYTNGDEAEDTEVTTTSTSSVTPYTISTSSSPESPSLHEYKNLGQCCFGCWNWAILSKVLGQSQPPGFWIGTTLEGNQFLASYGFIFEDCRGPRVVREEATYSIDARSRKVNRGFLVTVMESPLLTFRPLCGRRRRLQRFHIQLFFRVLDLLKLLVMGCLVGSKDNTRDNGGQVIALLIISCFMLALTRVTRPFLSRVDMAVGMLSEAADIFVFTLLLVVLWGSPRSDRHPFFEKLGVAMMVVQCFTLAVMVLRYAVSTMSVSITCTSYIRNQRQQTQQSKFVKLVWRQYSPYLERKYFDAWMVKALHKGLNGRRVKASELPRSVAARRYFHELRVRILRIFSLKEQSI